MSMIAPVFRRNFLDTRGKIGLTLALLLVSFFDMLNEVRKLKQITHTKGSSTGGEDDTGVGGSKAGPSSRQDPHAIRSLVEGDAIFPPAGAIAENLKLLAVQRMKGVGHRENSFR
jgi:hypothetical protein